MVPGVTSCLWELAEGLQQAGALQVTGKGVTFPLALQPNTKRRMTDEYSGPEALIEFKR